jgi:K+-transporting ATPase c subunit
MDMIKQPFGMKSFWKWAGGAGVLALVGAGIYLIYHYIVKSFAEKSAGDSGAGTGTSGSTDGGQSFTNWRSYRGRQRYTQYTPPNPAGPLGALNVGSGKSANDTIKTALGDQKTVGGLATSVRPPRIGRATMSSN